MVRERMKIGGALTVIAMGLAGVALPDTSANVLVMVVGILDPVLGAIFGAGFEQAFDVTIYDASLQLIPPVTDLVIEYQLQYVVYGLAGGVGIGMAADWLQKHLSG